METIKDLPLMERPREKLSHFGAAALSNTELIAILLGSGSNKMPVIHICEQLVGKIDDQPNRLCAMSIGQLREIKGIGEVKAIILAAAVELGRRAISPHNKPLSLATDDQVTAFLVPYLKRQESAGYFLIMINGRKELLATQEFVIDQNGPPQIKVMIQIALDSGAAEIILCRASFDLPASFLNQEKAFIIQLDAAASMMAINMRGLLVVTDKRQHQEKELDAK